MAYQYIHVDERDGVLIITMDDPKTRNAIGAEMREEIDKELDRLESDPALRCLIMTGKDPAFCSGANVRGMARSIESREEAGQKRELAEKPWDAMEQRLSDGTSGRDDSVRFLPIRLSRLQKPSIAAVNGFAMGLGLGIALSCDIRISSDKASFSETFIQRGLIPADGSCWQLPRMIGLTNTFMMQYTGDKVDPDSALRMGMVSKVVPHDALMEETMTLATRIAQGPTYAMGVIKWLVQKSLQTDFEESMRVAGVAQSIARDSYDHKEGVQAFLEKRPPQYKGR